MLDEMGKYKAFERVKNLQASGGSIERKGKDKGGVCSREIQDFLITGLPRPLPPQMPVKAHKTYKAQQKQLNNFSQ